ncbi:hypothetical protein [Chryseolinea soli]|uniref:Uncharacterized protein n=1 Tax=Chryseolinea soli TaxID=2321403 RepID=A0A385SX61_9BACT|nr:hypothetical protein [Chryseolinea soli]AYB34310.1 hypothetical protein D4L85_28685 [Chryseolinea soli]
MERLRAGQWQVGYENGFLRHLQLGSHEILRMVYFALRDENWTTLDKQIQNEVRDVGPDLFRIAYDCVNVKNGNTVFRWHAVLEGRRDGSITFEISGEALADQLKNRAGFCVLHPPDTTLGQPAEALHTNGDTTRSAFPVNVDPVNPFKDMKGLRWQTLGDWYTLAFEGDVFETEDQRNWTDASFKTFCTPSNLPFPVSLKKGDRVHQKITFMPPALPPMVADEGRIRILVNKDRVTVPEIGVGAASNVQVSPAIGRVIREMGLSHFRIDVRPLGHDWVTGFSEACVAASELQLAPEVALHLSADYKLELDAFTQLCLQNRLSLKRVLLLGDSDAVTPQAIIDQASSLKTHFPKTHFGAGTNYNFQQLNQRHIDATAVDFVSFAAHPQEHAIDDLSLIENLGAQEDVIFSAQALYPDHAVHISPITLKKRFNPYASDPKNITMSETDRTDPRQSTPFCAVWTLGSIKHLTEAGASGVTYYQTHGPQGIVSADGAPYPVGDTLRKLLALPRNVLSSYSTQPLKVDGFVFEDSRMVVWNYTAEEQTVHINDRVVALKPYAIHWD